MKKIFFASAIIFLGGLSWWGASSPTPGPTATASESKSESETTKSTTESHPAGASSGQASKSSELSILGRQILDSMPTAKTLARDGGDFHQTPELYLQSAVLLGKFKEEFLSELVTVTAGPDRLSLLDRGLEFYRACLENETALTSLRALCYTDWMELSTVAGRREELDSLRIPHEIVSLAKTLNEKTLD